MAAVVVAFTGGANEENVGMDKGSTAQLLAGDRIYNSSANSLQCNLDAEIGDVDVCMAEITPACMAFTPTPGVPTDTSTERQGGVGSAAFYQQSATPDGEGSAGGVAYPADAEFATLICSYPWPCEEALAVVYGTSNCPNGESSGKAWVLNNGCYGLFQIRCVSHRDRFIGECEVLYDPQVNVRVAYDIYIDNGGWSPWTCRP